MGLFGGGAVHFKANLVLLHYEPNDAAVFGKMRYVANREQSLMLGGGENRPQAALFRRSDEQNAARGQILNRGKSLYSDFFPSMLSPSTVASRTAPNGSFPKTQMVSVCGL